MIFNLPKEKDRTLVYGLHYFSGLEFGKLMGPKEKPRKIQRENCVASKRNLTPAQLGLRRTCERGK